MKNETLLHPGKSKIISKILYLVGKYLYAIRFKIVVEVPDNVKSVGPLLVLSKHCSNHDMVLGLPAMADYLGREDAWCIIKDSLTKPYFFGFFLKIGGIPVNRNNPEKSKEQLLFARKTLYDGNLLVIFPEQSRHPNKVGRGKSPGFRFIAGKPVEPINTICVGLEYTKGLLRRKLTIRFGNLRPYSKKDDAETFLHESMLEIARLTNMPYKFPPPEPKKKTTV
ncbi:1-acyl-sn-glycerol-3-phosphate acyltransferase [Leptospira ognonensis]|uniref:1-acyl-sn-glycerol-3-phosphate acyltransferase n=1 Tax=Leptospira ognonensis TaxID=2484945 RepID=A0A4R9K7D7_9LEPT|nr:lysophospholipid acyltransferase family protein [Leptospira ognonensis]TGL62229.1 1-acyl-sn-glycerol-3-phosphate acyltransferase [Leptospira ognonensis]